jgi:hypothetical protein
MKKIHSVFGGNDGDTECGTKMYAMTKQQVMRMFIQLYYSYMQPYYYR